MLTVLVVDDNVDVATTLAMLIELNGHDVEVAYDGFGAIEKAKARLPQVAIIDIGMPGMDGYELAGELRRVEGGERIAVATITGYGSLQDRQRSAQAGIELHLTKPANPVQILAFLQDVESRPQ